MDRPRIRSRTFAGALACALTGPLLVLSACGGGDDSVADPPISSSPSSSSPTSAPHRETPEHFIRRWTQAEEKMENTGETRRYLALSHECGPCRKLATKVKGYYRAGGYVRWGGWHILSIKKYSNHRSFAVHSNSMPTQYKTSSSAPVQHFSGGSITYVLELKETADAWVVINKSELDS